jgi:hypothetical protein
VNNSVGKGIILMGLPVIPLTGYLDYLDSNLVLVESEESFP